MTWQSRWRLILGADADPNQQVPLEKEEKELEELLSSVYSGESGKQFGRSAPKIRSWLEGIRRHFSNDIVQLMQRDALERRGVTEMLLEPELLEKIEPNAQMVAAILQLQELLPDKTKATARQLVRKLSHEVEKKLRPSIQNAVQRTKGQRSRRIAPGEAQIDWKKTILRNLKNYQPSVQTIVPEHWYGFRKGVKLPEVYILIDKSESMMTSAVYASIIGAVLASLKSIETHLIFFDTEIHDLTGKYQDPVDILFSVPMGGGTDIAYAVMYVGQKMKRPKSSLLFLISDLFECGDRKELVHQCQNLLSRGCKILSLLCLDDKGRPEYDAGIAHQLTGLKIPCFACNPDLFPEVLEAELNGLSLG